jgi:hypothetical protein
MKVLRYIGTDYSFADRLRKNENSYFYINTKQNYAILRATHSSFEAIIILIQNQITIHRSLVNTNYYAQSC